MPRASPSIPAITDIPCGGSITASQPLPRPVQPRAASDSPNLKTAANWTHPHTGLRQNYGESRIACDNHSRPQTEKLRILAQVVGAFHPYSSISRITGGTVLFWYKELDIFKEQNLILCFFCVWRSYLFIYLKSDL